MARADPFRGSFFGILKIMTSFSANPAVSWDERADLLRNLKKECARQIHLGLSGNKSKFVMNETHEALRDGFTVNVYAPKDPNMSPAERGFRGVFMCQQQLFVIGSMSAEIISGRNSIRVTTRDAKGAWDMVSFKCDAADRGKGAYLGADEMIGNWILHMSALSVEPPREPIAHHLRASTHPA